MLLFHNNNLNLDPSSFNTKNPYDNCIRDPSARILLVYRHLCERLKSKGGRIEGPGPGLGEFWLERSNDDDGILGLTNPQTLIPI
ncbi:hypothetical protein Moror_15233 [Moniliophthora roreri MCA 2997]|uniref:Uncharacterized protein n=1 Tax=Moniliophthora roreri (strain MCA 2997) TaxID=1381753 RepID=V2WM32_MONRO|nr:hypothetical protein Moror_15233 [Moniliophthora roreri MCA 2997]